MKMLYRVSRLLKDKRGFSGYFEIAVLILVFLMILTLSVSFLNVYAKHNLVNAMAHEIARYVEIKGEINGQTAAEIQRLKDISGFGDATVTFDKSGKLDLEEEFMVTVTVERKFGIGGIQVIPVTIQAVATGRSEVYWK